MKKNKKNCSYNKKINNKNKNKVTDLRKNVGFVTDEESTDDESVETSNDDEEKEDL